MLRMLLGLVVALGCVLPESALAGLRIVASVPDLAAIAREVTGDKPKITSLSLATQDPHWVDARPNLALDLSRADVLLVVGLDLEIGWLPVLQTGSRNQKIQRGALGFIDCSTFIQPLQMPAGQVDRTMGDVHPGGNPHYLYDPRRASQVAMGLAHRLGALDPDNAALYANNAADFVERVERDRTRWEADLSSLRGQNVIQYHRSWTYLQDWLGFELVAEIEPRPGIPPTPAHVAKVLQAAQKHEVKVILQEPYFPKTTPQLIADRSGARLVELPSGTDFQQGQTYFERMELLVTRLKKSQEAP